ncbi:MAG: hypothetical protein GY795_31660 [Desulfobacterales bacterium]|nr:hypothetical protein [Desulfobacterales bacterium]
MYITNRIKSSVFSKLKFLCICILLLAAIHLFCCSGFRCSPKNPDNICEIFRENRAWYKSANDSYKKWGIPIGVMMAIMYHESGFRAKARPPRTTCLFIFPGPRPSTAYGYAQAVDGTWKRYKQLTGNRGAERDSFEDAIDFIGWYCNQSNIICKIGKNDADSLYFAYHEGHRGYNRRTYRKKNWLKQVASDVQRRSDVYSRQMRSCESEFRRKKWGCLWPF